MLVLKISVALGLLSFLASLSMVQQGPSLAPKTGQICSPETLVGRYVITSGEKDGIREPEERISGTTVVFTKETVVVADKNKQEIYSASYKLDSTRNPCNITMTSLVKSSSGEIAQGLIKKEGEKLQLIYALPTGEIPASFKTKEKQLMFMMQKVE